MNKVFVLFDDFYIVGIFSTFSLATASIKATYFPDDEMPEWEESTFPQWQQKKKRSWDCHTLLGHFSIEEMSINTKAINLQPT